MVHRWSGRQKTVQCVALMCVLQEYMPPSTSWDSSSPDYTQMLYERGFPDMPEAIGTYGIGRRS